MKYWEFLIQKEGDQTWLPLEAQQVEILEGRYRVVAHTDRVDAPMDIRVSQLITDEMPPRKRVRKRAGRTNATGLVVVIPFMHLKPGQWELNCSSQGVMDDLMGEGWQYSVQLQVFSCLEEDLPQDWPTSHDSGPISHVVEEEETAPDPASEDLPLVQAQAALANQRAQQGGAQGAGGGQLASPAVPVFDPDSYHYRIALKQQAYLARHNQPMTIVGKVNSLSEALHEEASQLWIRLQNPQTAQVIMEANRPLSLARLPADFKVQIQLPAEVSTRVILGEVSLRTAAVDAKTPARVLTSTAFTITAGIAQLLDTLASKDPGAFEEEVAVLSAMPPATPASEAQVSPTLPVPDVGLARPEVVPAVGVVLPPQLDRAATPGVSQADLPAAQAPTLPTFGGLEGPADTAANLTAPLIVSDGAGDLSSPPPSTDLPVTEFPASPANSPANFEEDTISPPVGVGADASSPATAPANAAAVSQPPMVAQPAQFVGTSIFDDDLEADEIASVLEDIDEDLRADESDLDAFEAPGIEGVLPGRTGARSRNHRYEPAPLDPFGDDEPLAEERPELSDSDGQPEPARAERDQPSSGSATPSFDFQSLKLKDHFWQRLSALTHEGREEAAELAKNVKAAGVTADGGDGFSEAMPFADGNEVVIYDEPAALVSDAHPAEPMPPTPAQPGAAPMNSTPLSPPSSEVLTTAQDAAIGNRRAQRLARLKANRQSNSQASRQSNPQSSPQSKYPQSKYQMGQPSPPLTNSPVPSARNSGMPAHTGSSQPVPISLAAQSAQEELPEMSLPVISVPMGDLVAGDIITVVVRTRPSVYKPFIKLWMVDRQSRSVVIEPQLLTSLRPDALGDLEASAQLPVPRDCLDVQIAAIAIDMATQQESGKAVVNRHVVPADQRSSRSRFKF